MIGERLLDRWTVQTRLGEGGMGTVYLAVDDRGEQVAIKRLSGHIAETPGLAARFAREAEALAMLAHPNIAALYTVGMSEEIGMYFVMEYIVGHELATELEHGPLARARALEFGMQILSALDHAHQFGLVHRDLKPENMLVGSDTSRDPARDIIKLIDFGLVKMVGDVLGSEERERLTSTGVIFGSPQYMAPEQMLGQPVDHRSDLYAFGIVLFELLTGRRPFVAEDITELWRAHVNSPIPHLRDVDPELDDPELDAILHTLLGKRPDQRFDTALAARRAIESVR